MPIASQKDNEVYKIENEYYINNINKLDVINHITTLKSLLVKTSGFYNLNANQIQIIKTLYNLYSELKNQNKNNIEYKELIIELSKRTGKTHQQINGHIVYMSAIGYLLKDNKKIYINSIKTLINNYLDECKEVYND